MSTGDEAADLTAEGASEALPIARPTLDRWLEAGRTPVVLSPDGRGGTNGHSTGADDADDVDEDAAPA